MIVGWQVSSRGYPWLDKICALAVAALVLTLAFGLFKRAIPILVDRVAVDPELVREVTSTVAGVRAIRSVRSRSKGNATAVDMVVVVGSDMTASKAHDIADAIERKLRTELQVEDATIHIEPDS